MKLINIAKLLGRDITADNETISIELMKIELKKQFILIFTGKVDAFNFPEAKQYAYNQLFSNSVNEIAIIAFVSNPTVEAALSRGELISDGDIEYVVVNEVLPLIIPVNK